MSPSACCTTPASLLLFALYVASPNGASTLQCLSCPFFACSHRFGVFDSPRIYPLLARGKIPPFFSVLPHLPGISSPKNGSTCMSLRQVPFSAPLSEPPTPTGGSPPVRCPAAFGRSGIHSFPPPFMFQATTRPFSGLHPLCEFRSLPPVRRDSPRSLLSPGFVGPNLALSR